MKKEKNHLPEKDSSLRFFRAKNDGKTAQKNMKKKCKSRAVFSDFLHL